MPIVCWLLRPSWLQAHCVSVWLFGLENLTAEPRIFSRRQAVSSSCRTQPNPNKIPKVLEKRNLFISNPKSQNPRFFVEFNVRLLPAQRDHGSEKLPSHLGKSSEKNVHKVLFWQGIILKIIDMYSKKKIDCKTLKKIVKRVRVNFRDAKFSLEGHLMLRMGCKSLL